MKILYKQGDLMQCPERYIAHGCNMQGVFGRGVAYQIRHSYPDAYRVYLAQHNEGLQKLGTVTFASSRGKVVFNCITQEFYGAKKDIVYVDYWAMRECMAALDYYAQYLDDHFTREGVSIAMPLIGAGLANGDWSIIEKIIEEEAKHFQPVIYKL